MVHKNTRSFSNIESCQNDDLKVKVILEHCSQAKYVLPYCDIIQLKLILYGCPCACEWRKKNVLALLVYIRRQQTLLPQPIVKEIERKKSF